MPPLRRQQEEIKLFNSDGCVLTTKEGNRPFQSCHLLLGFAVYALAHVLAGWLVGWLVGLAVTKT